MHTFEVSPKMKWLQFGAIVTVVLAIGSIAVVVVYVGTIAWVR